MQSENQSGYTIELCPTLYPTHKEFENFQDYVNKIEREYSDKTGIVKVVPPKKWKARQGNYDVFMDQIKIPGPIEQNTYGKGGVYELLLIQRKSMTLSEFRKKADYFNHMTENKEIEDVEEAFWKNISFSPPLYGADFMYSLFDQNVVWNLAELDTFLTDGLPQQISGVTFPYLYIGAWKSMFGWHKEDLDLNSINFNHLGKPKFWYSLPPDQGEQLEKFARSHFSDGFSKCSEYLRHKTVMISPYLLKQKLKGDIPITKACQKPGEYIITLSGAYHCGFNWGFNIGKYKNEPEVELFKEQVKDDEQKQKLKLKKKIEVEKKQSVVKIQVYDMIDLDKKQDNDEEWKCKGNKQKPTSTSAVIKIKKQIQKPLKTKVAGRKIKQPIKFSL